ncbi:MAG: hypothetical protein NZ923_10305, partial [Candidatus Kryptonium sp.]|nr:hypothetical protein [Candidatus Kryptonium sp.]
MIAIVILIFLLKAKAENSNFNSIEQNYLYEFQYRKNTIISFYSDSFNLLHKKPDFFVLTVKLKFRKDFERSLKWLDLLIQNPEVDNMFFAYQLMGLYLHCKDNLSNEYRDKIKNTFKTKTIYRGDTENHWLMYYIAWYLISQEWQGETWSNLKTSSELFHESEEYINYWINQTVSFGQIEFDSPTYIITYIPPLCLLYDFAEDTLMKRKAQMMIEYILADYAVEYLVGCYCGGHSRDYSEFVINPRYAQARTLGYLYFGQIDFKPYLKESNSVIFCALSSFYLPDIIYYIATDRAVSYEHRERKRVRNIIRFGKERNPAVYKYTYMTRDYCMGSLQGGILQPIQQHSWDITFSDFGDYNTVFSVHPYFSEIELGMFFPEEIKILPELVDRAHKIYRNPNKWSSSSPYERIFQYEGTLIALYDFTGMTFVEQYRHINIFIPKQLDYFEMDTLGWIIGKRGNGYFGIMVLGARSISLVVD